MPSPSTDSYDNISIISSVDENEVSVLSKSNISVRGATSSYNYSYSFKIPLKKRKTKLLYYKTRININLGILNEIIWLPSYSK